MPIQRRSFAFGRQIVFHDAQSLPSPRCQADWHVIPGMELLETSCAKGSNLVPTPTVVVRTASMRRVGRHSEELPHTGDLELWLRLGLFGSVCRIEADQAYKRIHAVNMQHQFIEPAIGDLRHRKAAFEVLFRNHGASIPELDRLQSLALAAWGWRLLGGERGVRPG